MALRHEALPTVFIWIQTTLSDALPTVYVWIRTRISDVLCCWDSNLFGFELHFLIYCRQSSMETVNVAGCAKIVMFADTTISNDKDEPGLIDSGVIFAMRFLQNRSVRQDES